jgi:FAD/FMN-containing dehydrogenase
MTDVASPSVDIESLRAALEGQLLGPQDADYDEARKIWNGMLDRHPAAVARCASVSDVVAAVNFARRHDLLLAIRCGGHSTPGYSTCDAGLVIDLRPMNRVTVDPQARTARAPGGTVGRV